MWYYIQRGIGSTSLYIPKGIYFKILGLTTIRTYEFANVCAHYISINFKLLNCPAILVIMRKEHYFTIYLIYNAVYIICRFMTYLMN